METLKKIAKTVFSNTVKEYITSLVGLIILIVHLVRFYTTGKFDFANDAPMIVFALFLFTIKDPAFLFDLVKKMFK